jgi:hypothetical protein
MKNIIVVMGEKGGAGKTILSTQFLPLILLNNTKEKDLKDLSIKLALIDSNNKMGYASRDESKVKVVEKLKAKNSYSMEEFTEFFEDTGDSLKSNDYLVVDVGGGEDTNVAIKALSKAPTLNDALIVVPFYLTDEYVSGMISTVAKIKASNNRVKIVVVANRVGDKYTDEAEARGIPLIDVVEKHLKNMLGGSEYRTLVDSVDTLMAIEEFTEACENAKDGTLMFDAVYENAFDANLTYSDEADILKQAYKKEEDSEQSTMTYRVDRKMLVKKYSYIDVLKSLKDFSNTLGAIK